MRDDVAEPSGQRTVQENFYSCSSSAEADGEGDAAELDLVLMDVVVISSPAL